MNDNQPYGGPVEAGTKLIPMECDIQSEGRKMTFRCAAKNTDHALHIISDYYADKGVTVTGYRPSKWRDEQ